MTRTIAKAIALQIHAPTRSPYRVERPSETAMSRLRSYA
jgi:hypothetical protein